MRRFEYAEYEKYHTKQGKGIVSDAVKTAVKKAATTIGEHVGKKGGDKIIELLSKKKRKSGTESEIKTGGEIKRKRGRPRKIK